MDIKALQLAARFSLPPNSLGYCGSDSAPAKLIKCVTDGVYDGVEEELSKFIVLNPYLKTISQIIDQPIFSYPVIEAYCLGNNELKKAKIEHYGLLLDNFSAQGVPSWLVEELKLTPPNVFIPFHLFQVLHVGVGRASGSVPYNIETINNCMIRWGRVQKITGDEVVVKLKSLRDIRIKYELTNLLSTITTGTKLVPQVKVGNVIAVHWNQIIKTLEPREEQNLAFWTNQVLINQRPKP